MAAGVLAGRWWVVAAVAVALAGAGVADLRVWPPLATVMSASMAPTIKPGDVVVLKRIEGRPRVGDIVAVTVPDDARTRYGYPPEVVHRVVRVSRDGAVITKGDARQARDPFAVPAAAVTAKVVATVPAAGRLLAFLTSGVGLLWLAAGTVLLVVMPVVDRQRDAQRDDRDTAEVLRSELGSVAEELAAVHARLAARARRDAELDRRLDELIHESAAIELQITTVATALAQNRQQIAPVAQQALDPPPSRAPAQPDRIDRRAATRASLRTTIDRAVSARSEGRAGGLVGMAGRYTRSARRRGR